MRLSRTFACTTSCVAAVLASVALVACSPEPRAAGDELDSLSSALDTTPTGVWKLRDWGTPPLEDHVRLVYHARMARVLHVSARPNTGVFSWDGSDWTRVANANSALFMQGAAYDEARARVVVFGGLVADHVGAGNSRGTWLFDGAAWQAQMPSGPLAGGGATLVYDAARDRTVLTGGGTHTNATPREETWLFDGTAWAKAVVPESPASQYAGAAYDRMRALAVLVRPVNGTGSETWEWNGTAWSRIPAAVPLPYEYSYSLAYDETSKRVVSMVEGALWGWDGSAWTRLDASDGRESERKRATIAYDAARARLVAHNASSYSWEYDGSSWHKLAPKRPRPRNEAASTYDSARGRVIYFGSVGELDDATWEWDGTSWTRGPRAPVETPTGLTITYDSRRSRTVLVLANKTWEYDGAAWVEIGPAPFAAAPLLAYDAARGLTVALHGAATWTWDGVSWRQHAALGPSSARDSAMAYDAQRERIVRFGGYTDGSGSSQIDETWEWDGSAWTLMAPVSRPTPRGGHGMAFDSRRGRIVIYGGYRHNELWEYDGLTWLQRVAPTAPAGSFASGLVYDAARQRMVFYTSDGTLWEFQPVGDACTTGDQCPSGACVAGVCCDRACSSSCEACSLASGATQNGVCQLLPDAGAKCMSSDVDASAGSAEGGHAPSGKRDGGCSLTPSSSDSGEPRVWIALIALVAVAVRSSIARRAPRLERRQR
jgi:hypothetical protein